ncbi:MAG TPA: alpha/beta hydrolase [Candidatus Saccharimonadales bacterium]|nr:alpha/beta hydrolase [Candidatus Saccharimonadales bacterium]
MGISDTIWHKWLQRPYRLAASDTKHGTKTVVLLHGVGASGAVWHALVKQLEAVGWRVIVPDLLGFGDSPKPQWNNYTVHDHARHVVALLKRLRVKGKVTIVGHSMGTLVATHIAATHPKLVSRLVLYEPPLYADDPEFTGHMRRREYYFALYTFIATHPQLAFTQARLMWRVAKRLVGLHLSPEEWTPFERSLRNTIMKQTAYAELHSVQVPTDIVHGRLDIVVTRKDLRRMYRQNRFITWHTVTDTHGISQRSARYLGHLLNGTTPPKRRRRRTKKNPR